jgi:hypothetical protein
MKLKLIAAAAAIAWGLVPALGSAMEDAGNADKGDFSLVNVQDLVDLCTVPQGQDLSDKGAYFCMGYMTGVIQYHNALSAGPDEKPVICPDPSVTRLDMVETFVNWARAHPQYSNERAIEGVTAAAISKWPCI